MKYKSRTIFPNCFVMSAVEKLTKKSFIKCLSCETSNVFHSFLSALKWFLKFFNGSLDNPLISSFQWVILGTISCQNFQNLKNQIDRVRTGEEDYENLDNSFKIGPTFKREVITQAQHNKIKKILTGFLKTGN